MQKLFQTFAKSEIYVHSFELRSSRILWFTTGAYLTYDYFSPYLKLNQIKKATFQRNFKKIHEKYQEGHFLALKSNLDLEGFPDEGDWLYSKLIPEEELAELLLMKNRYEDRWKEYCYIMPMFIIGGLWTPVVTSMLGGSLVFANRMVDKQKNQRGFVNLKEYVIWGLIANSFVSCFGLKFY